MPNAALFLVFSVAHVYLGLYHVDSDTFDLVVYAVMIVSEKHVS